MKALDSKENGYIFNIEGGKTGYFFEQIFLKEDRKMSYCREHRDNGIMFIGYGDRKTYALCEKTTNGMWTLVKNCDVTYSDVLTFATKKAAISFVRKSQLPMANIVKLCNNFGQSWALSWANALDGDMWVHTIFNFGETENGNL